MPAPESYLFVDGNCLDTTLSKISERYFDNAKIEIDFSRLKRDHRKAYYYDAVPVRGWEEAADVYEARTSGKRAELSTIARQDGYHVRAGDAHARKGRGREQKMVDVQLAVDMMALANQGVFSKATLLTGDLDFKPLVDALVAMGVDLSLLYPIGETNAELIEAADRALPLNVSWVSHLFSDAFKQAHPLPSACYVSKGDKPTITPFFFWDDGKFGRCGLGRNSDHFELMTSEGSDTHQLQLLFKDLDQARRYSEDVFGLKFPEDIPGFS